MNAADAAFPNTTRIDWSLDLIADLITEDPNLTGTLEVVGFDSDGFDTDYDPWVVAGQAEAIADRVGIRISRDKQLTYVALIEDRCVGAVWSNWYQTDEYDEDEDGERAWVFDFDVVSDPAYRAAGPIGVKLIEAALDEYRAANWYRKMIRVYVVNPKLINFLERHYGFESEGTYSHGAAHMTYWG